MYRRLLLVITLVGATNAALAVSATNPLFTARALDCKLGTPEATATDSSVNIRDIDHAQHTATLREASSPAHRAQIVTTESGITFIEHAASGSLIFTTIFAGPPEEAELYAVQSRHLTVMTGIPQLSQRVGFCTVSE